MGAVAKMPHGDSWLFPADLVSGGGGQECPREQTFRGSSAVNGSIWGV